MFFFLETAEGELRRTAIDFYTRTEALKVYPNSARKAFLEHLEKQKNIVMEEKIQQYENQVEFLSDYLKAMYKDITFYSVNNLNADRVIQSAISDFISGKDITCENVLNGILNDLRLGITDKGSGV